jgi:hypothetical protein
MLRTKLSCGELNLVTNDVLAELINKEVMYLIRNYYDPEEDESDTSHAVNILEEVVDRLRNAP